MPYRDEKWGLSLAAVLIFFTAANVFVRDDFWMSVQKMDVLDTKAGEEILIDYERTLRRPFTADWRVKIRRVTDGGLEWVCATPVSREDYDAKSTIPQPVTLRWFAWTDERCYDLGPGQYVISATWEINPDGFATLFFRRTVTKTDTFTIGGAE